MAPSSDSRESFASSQLASGNRPLPVAHSRVSESVAGDWKAYCDVWRKHFEQPHDATIRQRLGLSSPSIQVTQSSGRSTAAAMRLPVADLQRFESEHFMLLTDVPAKRANQVITDLEKFYSVWTQLFFPLWRDQNQWDRSLKSSRPRVTIKHRVVLFQQSTRYSDLLKAEGPGIGQSTGFYSDLKRVTFLTDEASVLEADKLATRFHEITHQLMTEATDAKPRTRPGERRDFWLVEGIACFVESTLMHQDHATVGGWQASRLQYARHRVLATSDMLALSDLLGEGRLAVQQRDDLARWYSFVAAYTHQLIDANDGSGLIDVMDRLATIYQLRNPFIPRTDPNETTIEQQTLSEYLSLDDSEITPVGTSALQDLCLTRTAVTPEALQCVVPQAELRWLDLSYLKVTTETVLRLSPSCRTLEQLSLEATLVDDSLADWLRAANRLRELDLSSTRAGDAVLGALPRECPLETLWLTGSQVSDVSVDHIAQMKNLVRLDVQQTAVTDEGLQRLKALRPELQINPLELAAP